MSATSNTTRLSLLKVNQWLRTWNDAEWTKHLPKPKPHFYVASVSLKTLRKLAGVSKRTVSDRREGTNTAGYQRAHQPERSKSIARYLRYGYPLSNEPGLDVTSHKSLIHPGWLPTAILVNVVGEKESRRRAGKDRTVRSEDLVVIKEDARGHYLEIPAGFSEPNFKLHPAGLEPLEIIDGQHRLFAVDELAADFDLENYDVPVIFFDGLTTSWQAYLFWVINVEPKKINPSLAYDLYPELRNQNWLQSGEGIKVYQEHRAQELTEVLWRHPSSPWQDRIELHGNRVEGHVSNAAFIRSLMVSFIRRWGKEERIGGLFGSVGSDNSERILPWKRPQQAAYLIACWKHIADAVAGSNASWVKPLNAARGSASLPAFNGPHTLLGTDQGARAVLVVFNALSQVKHDELELEEWESDEVSDIPENDDVSQALQEFRAMKKANSFLKAVSEQLIAQVDWRTSSAPGLEPQEKVNQSIYRGSSGYSQLQKVCFDALKLSSDRRVADAANIAAELLKR